MNRNATILAVDDTSESLALLVELLTPAGYTVRAADSGELALAAVAASPPDLILLDVRMEGLDGLEVCRRLKADEATRTIPIILMSAFADSTDWVTGLQLGAADYITKPIQTAELLTRVKAHLSLSRARVGLERQAVELRDANERLRLEALERSKAEEELRRSLDRAERSRRAMLSTLEDQRQAEQARVEIEAQLRGVQKMEAIGGLAGGIAHDFNNLLSVILSYTDFVLEGLSESDPLRSDLLEVKKAGERAAVLTRQLLAFSRKQVLQPVPLNLNEVALGVEKMLRRVLGEDIDLLQKLTPDLGLTLADPGQIEQVLMNLVVNARDAMPDGGRLTIETSDVEIDAEYAARHLAVEPGPYVLLAVTDTGCGMDEETKARLFEPFYTTKEKGKGTGLGLSTVYGIIKQSGGNIWVYSEPGQGTTFKIYLPRVPSAALTAAATASTAPRRSTGTETILVVDDEAALREVARRTLEAAGYRVLTAEGAAEALDAAARHTGAIHLLLTDVVMPHMNGKALALALTKTRPTLKILFMSGYTDNAFIHRGVLDAGADFLAKPFAAAALTRKVREVLDGVAAEHLPGNPPEAAEAVAEPDEQPRGRGHAALGLG